MLRRAGEPLHDALVGDLPASLSLRTKVRIILEVQTQVDELGLDPDSIDSFVVDSTPCLEPFFSPSQARPLGHLWMIYQIVLTLLSCGYMAISSTYFEDGIFIEEMVFGASVLLDLLLRFYASDRRWVVTERKQGV